MNIFDKLIPMPLSASEGKNSFQLHGAVISFQESLENEAEILISGLWDMEIASDLETIVDELEFDDQPSFIRLDIDKSLSEQAYTLSASGKVSTLVENNGRTIVCSSKIEIKGGSPKGVFYGIQTLLQILKLTINQHGWEEKEFFDISDKELVNEEFFYQNNIRTMFESDEEAFFMDEEEDEEDFIDMNRKVTLKEFIIKDEPAREVRGFYHDITRGKVPTLETLMELADMLAAHKINQLQLYVEHTFAFDGMSEIWRGADPLMPEEIKELDEYCKERHIDLVPSLSCFGHLYTALMTRSFGHLSELDDSEKRPYNLMDRMAHHTLDVSNPDSFAFVKKMLDQYIPLFSSDLFNICCDETFDLGKGKNKELAEKIGKGKLYVDFLNKIIGYVQSKGKKVMFWGDIALEHPEYLKDIPEDVTMLIWNYEADVTDDDIKKVSELKIENYVCPGTWGWNNLMNDIEKSFENIRRSGEYAEKYKSKGILNTDWGDFGHVNFLSGSIPGMVYGAAVSWNPQYHCSRSVEQTLKDISVCVFGDPTKRIVSLMRDIKEAVMLNWGDLVAYDLDRNMGYTHEWFNKDFIDRYTVDEINLANERMMNHGMDRMLINAVIMHNEVELSDQYALDEMDTVIKGIPLFNAYLLFLKGVLSKEQAVVLAEQFEMWMEMYSFMWRARNKESELFRIKEIIYRIADHLRS